MRIIGIALIFVIFTSCIEKYDFNVINDTPGIVIEASISDKSFIDAQNFPSYGRYFEVILGKTSKVDNVRDERISGADVYLEDSKGNKWNYEEEFLTPGHYYLKNDFFKARPDTQYQLKINLKEGQEFESNWEQFPSVENVVGDTYFDEVKPEKYVWEVGERIIKEVRGINVKVKVPENPSTQMRFYRWDFDASWIYKAALVPEEGDPGKTCWIESKYYLEDYVLQENQSSGFDQEMFFLKTTGNEVIFEYFSTLIHQELITEGYYNFWKDLDAQKIKGGLFDQPSYGLLTNFKSTNSDWTVNGYFGVISESVIHWGFKLDELSYSVNNYLFDFCSEYAESVEGDLPDPCLDCRGYRSWGSTSTDVLPPWLED